MFLLDPSCELAVLAGPPTEDTAFEDLGDGLQGPASRAVRRALQPLRKRIQQLGEAKALARCEELVAWTEALPEYDALCTAKVRDGRRVLKPSILFPAASDKPRTLVVRQGTGAEVQALTFEVAKGRWPAIHDLLQAMNAGLSERAVRKAVAGEDTQELFDTLVEAGWLGEREDDRAPKEARQPGLWFIGHNMALVASKKARVLIDPWFRPWRAADPAEYKGLRPCDVGPVDAIAITHTHGDHFHLGSLLTFPRDTPIYLPVIERNSLLAPDVGLILREIGFTNVRPLAWWDTAKVGDVQLSAMPFYGEQPSSIAVIDPALRNHGNTYFVRTPELGAAFLADTGRDGLGSMADVGLGARQRWGRADFVFGGMRGFETAPMLLPFTTIDAMWVNVPLPLLPVRQRLMNDANDLVIAAEIFGAKWVLPYADGGAPWFWREGMGPTYSMYPGYPGERPAPTAHEEDPAAAPFPERVFEAVERRAGRTSPLEAMVLRPGDLVQFHKGGEPRVGRIEGFSWPWSDTPLDERPVTKRARR